MKASCLRLKLVENFFVNFNTENQSNFNVSNTHPSHQDEPFQHFPIDIKVLQVDQI